MSLLELFCDVDDFYQTYAQNKQQFLLGQPKKRGPKPRLSTSEIMTIIIYFHMSGYRNFKTYYTQHVQNSCGLSSQTASVTIVLSSIYR
mgnify:CR=1 FL=1